MTYSLPDDDEYTYVPTAADQIPSMAGGTNVDSDPAPSEYLYGEVDGEADDKKSDVHTVYGGVDTSRDGDHCGSAISQGSSLRIDSSDDIVLLRKTLRERDAEILGLRAKISLLERQVS